MLSLEFFGIQKSPKEPKMHENEKLVLSLEFLGYFLRVPRGPATAYLMCFSLGCSEAKKIEGRAG